MTTPQQPTPQSTAEIHLVDDVDTSPTAHHHTLGYSPAQAAPGNHQHTGENSPVLTDYAPITHTHSEGDVTSLISDLGTKASNSHASTHAAAGSDVVTLTQGQITGLIAALAAKSATGHGHAEADIASLVADLAGKSPTTHTHDPADLTGLPINVTGHRDDPESALKQLLIKLDNAGIITDSTTAT